MKTICKCGKIIPLGTKCKCNKRVRNKATESETDKLMRTQRWKKLRLKIIKRDGGACLRCFYKYQFINFSNITVHHIKPRKEFPELMFDECNLLTLCQSCNGQLGITGKLDFEWLPPKEENMSVL